MVAAGVYYAKCKARACEVEVELFDDGVCGVCEVDRDESADSAGSLVHKSAGFTEVYVFGVLRHLRDFDVGDFAVVVEVVEDISDHYFKSGG